jgi:hypothetical protein
MFGNSSDSGMSGWLWYQMGRSAAESDRIETRAVRTVLGLNPPQVDVNAVLAQNRTLAAENARLRENLTDYEHNYRDLKKWADDASKRLIAYRNAQPG